MSKEAPSAATRFISYAQNYEDVMLWRALKHVENGFYIDVGANDPVADSVTKAFYDRGWRGINIEPLPVHCDGLRSQRPRDVTLCCAAGEAAGEIEIYDCDVRGWASGDKTVAERHAREGHQGLWRRVPMRTLADICHEHVAGPIHFLKIDVEGMEKQVIDGADFTRFRPWIVVVEAAAPHAIEDAHVPREEPLLTRGYRFAYCDGLNRFYVAEEHRDIMGSFRYPPNVFDEFVRVAQVMSEQRARHWESRARRAAEKARREQSKVRSLAQAQLALLDSQLALLNSTSWRVTAPLRAVYQGRDKIFRYGQKWLSSLPARRVLRLPLSAFRRFAGSHPKLKAFFSRNGGQAGTFSGVRVAQWRGSPLPETSATPEKRPRLAYVSPLPPERSGVSDYSARLLPELARFYDIDVVVSQPKVSAPRVTAHCGILNVTEFIQNRHRYHRVLYHFGNSRYHLHMFDLLERVPGVVVLHDFYLGHLQSDRESCGLLPHALTRALYRSHGYGAVAERFGSARLAGMVEKYPANIEVLENALGVIVHSRYCRRMAEEWYGPRFSRRFEVIPFLRFPETITDKEAARRRVGLKPDQFVVCSFGFIGSFKLNHLLLEAWLQSTLAQDPRCVLVFVGENAGDEYGANLLKGVAASGLKARIRITGWAEASTFKDYLAAADLAVQLRTCSRGETSAAALDAMSAGIPTIVNANGALGELPADAVWMLPDAFRTEQLVEALETLHHDETRRERLGARAREVISAGHNPESCAVKYAEALERFYARPEARLPAMIKEIASRPDSRIGREDLISLPQAMARCLPEKRPHHILYLDLSATARHDLRTGIERVARALTMALLGSAPPGFRVEPVYLSRHGEFWHYRHARRYTLELLGCPADVLEDTPADPAPGDIVLGLDISGEMLVEAEEAGFFRQLRNDGVAVYFMVHDLLPVRLPDCFPPGADARHERWLKAVVAMDGAVCVSQTVAADLAYWCHSLLCENRQRPLRLLVSHHGADFDQSFPTRGLPKNAPEIIAHCHARPTFLMVGTVEPRKGHLLVLEAFTELWDGGIDVNLVIAGKEGWADLTDGMRRGIPQIVEALKHHPERGRRLFWLEGTSDEFLQRLYDAATCLIAASLGEGFGLPLIEAAQHRLPIIARDIPVFREVAGPHAFYFHARHPAALAESLKHWLWLYDRDEHPCPDEMPWLTWQESALHLTRRLCSPVAEVASQGILPGTDATAASAIVAGRTLFVDISVVYRKDWRTGIQRVVRAMLASLPTQLPPGWRLVPVFAACVDGSWVYKDAGDCPAPGSNQPSGPDGAPARQIVNPLAGDVFLGLDLAGSQVVQAGRQNYYARLRENWVKVYFVVYDLLPLTHPEYFSPEDGDGHRQWLETVTRGDGVLCISRSVAAAVKRWLRENEGFSRPDFTVDWFHLGADLENSRPSSGITEKARMVLGRMDRRPSFLVVGTIEPRKGCDQVLGAFERLWLQGMDVNLVFAGGRGWGVDALVEKIRNHPERDRRLFWLQAASDECLEKLYAAATCLIAASADEGFGLPLIEAARYRLPVIARDIPVFREVAGEHAFYFPAPEDPDALALAIDQWLNLFASGKHPPSNRMPWLTWQQSAGQLVNRILGDSACCPH